MFSTDEKRPFGSLGKGKTLLNEMQVQFDDLVISNLNGNVMCKTQPSDKTMRLKSIFSLLVKLQLAAGRIQQLP